MLILKTLKTLFKVDFENIEIIEKHYSMLILKTLKTLFNVDIQNLLTKLLPFRILDDKGEVLNKNKNYENETFHIW